MRISDWSSDVCSSDLHFFRQIGPCILPMLCSGRIRVYYYAPYKLNAQSGIYCLMSLPPSTDRDLWVSWDNYHSLIERLALIVHESGWQFDKIMCLARGGVRVGDILSRIYDMPLGILATSSYREAAGTQQGQLDIAQFITITRGTLDGRVLLVDDMVDTGMTFNRVRDHLQSQFPAITELKTAVLRSEEHTSDSSH